MYPKVKVRQDEELEEEEEELDHHHHHPSEEEEFQFQRIFLKDFKSLSLYDDHHHHPSNSNSNSKSPTEHKHGYTPPHVRVPISGSGANKISSSSSKVVNKNNIAEVLHTKPASSCVLPPRTVLSSPENDAMLGTKNITKSLHQIHPNTHNKCNKSYQLDKRSKTKSSWKY